MPQAAPDTARGEQFAELFEKVGLSPEYMHDFIVALESVLMKNVTAQIESFRKEVLARFSIQDERATSLASNLAAAEANRKKDFDTLCGKIDSMEANDKTGFDKLNDKIDSMEANRKKEVDRLSDKIDQGFKAKDYKFEAQDDQFKALNDKTDERFDTLFDMLDGTNVKIDRMTKRLTIMILLVIGAILSAIVAITVQTLP